jgi:predicted DNA-binding transcriptional regulator AlpA
MATKSGERLEQRRAITVPEFAERYGLCRATVYEERKRGRLKISKVGAKSLIFDTDEEAWRNAVPAL